MESKLQGMRALVGGSTQGIGKATAKLLADKGAEVVLLARNKDKLENTLLELSSKQGQSHFILVADYNDPNVLELIVKEYLKKAKPINILVNNTGGPPSGLITSSTSEDFNNAFTNHLINNHNLAKLLIPGMKKSGYGRIINIISTSVKVPLYGLGVSNTVRAAVANWSKTLANELAIDGITVNNVLPGATLTDRLVNIIHNRAKKDKLEEGVVRQIMLDEIPMKRFADPIEIAQAVAFLASIEARYITGINLPVDGGRTPNL